MDTLLDSDSLVAGRLPQFGLLRFGGADAVSFLQGQISNDARRLVAHEPLLAAYSTPQGRVLTVLRLLPHSSGVIAILPRELVLSTLERLRKFVLRAKVTIEDLSTQFAVIGGQGAAADESRGYVERAGIGIARVAAGAARYWAVGSLADLHNEGFALHDAEAQRREQAWRLADIRAGLPQVYGATTELFVAQMLNLDRIDGISFTKGCFTGQEIIARTQHLGRIKRRLFRLRLPAGAWSIGQPIQLPDGRTGRLTELAPVREVHEALAVLNLEPVAAAGTADGEAAGAALVAATELPLPY